MPKDDDKSTQKTANRKKTLVFKDNQLVRADGIVVNKDLCTEIQAKLVCYVASMVREKDTEETIYTVKVIDFLRLINPDGKTRKIAGSYYALIKKNLRDMRKIGVDLETFDEQGNGLGTKGFSYFLDYDYKREDGSIDFRLHKELIKMYSNYDKKFSMINLAVSLTLKGTYAGSLYEFLCSWQGAKSFVCTVEQIRKGLSVPKGKYKNTRELFKRCVNPAMEEVNEKANFKVVMKPVDVYRQQIKTVEFKLSTKKQISKVPERLNKSEQFLFDLGVSLNQAKLFAASCTFERIEGNYNYTKQACISGKIDDQTGYLIRAIEKDYANVDGCLIDEEELKRISLAQKKLVEQQQKLLLEQSEKNLNEHKLSPDFAKKLAKKIK